MMPPYGRSIAKCNHSHRIIFPSAGGAGKDELYVSVARVPRALRWLAVAPARRRHGHNRYLPTDFRMLLQN